MKELISRKHPNFPPQILSDKEFEELKLRGLAKRYRVNEMKPIRQITPKSIIVKQPPLETPVIEKIKKPALKKSKNET